MQYKKQRKTNWWVIFLFIPLLVGCSPVTQQLFKVGVYVGGVLLETVVGKTIDTVVGKLFELIDHYLSDHVIVDADDPFIVDADDPLKGTYAGDLPFKGETANCKYTYSLKNPRIFRTAIDADWHPTSEAQERVKNSFDENC